MSLIRTAKRVSCSVLLIAISAGAADFRDAQKAFGANRCRNAISMGEQVSRRSSNMPPQVREDQEAELQRWHAALNACAELLPAQYKEQMAKLEDEYVQVTKLGKSAASTDQSCDLLRRIALFVNEVKASQLECECIDYVAEAEEFIKKSAGLCPEPCRQADQQLDDVLKSVYMISSNIKLSSNLLKLNQVSDFRKRVRRYKFQLLSDKTKVDSLASSMDYCLSRNANRNVGLIQGAAENLANGLGVLDRICGYLETIQRQAGADAARNRAFRDSVDLFYEQVSGIVDQWLSVSAPGDQPGSVPLQKSTAEKMHDMFFKLAKVDLQRSLYLLDRPVEEKKAEIVRLRSLSFVKDLAPEESQELDEMRNNVIQKLYMSIPWPIRFWEAKRATAIILLAAIALVITGSIIALIVARNKRRQKQRMVSL